MRHPSIHCPLGRSLFRVSTALLSLALFCAGLQAQAPLTMRLAVNQLVDPVHVTHRAGDAQNLFVAEIGGKDVAMVFLNSFGTRSPLGDAGRIRRWLESGTESSVANAAREHERRVRAAQGIE